MANPWEEYQPEQTGQSSEAEPWSEYSPAEPAVSSAEEPAPWSEYEKPSDDGAGLTDGRFWGGLGAQVAVSEGGRIATTALGAKLGLLGGPAAPVTVPLGAVAGFVIGGLGFGAAGSVVRQKIEGRDKISYGEMMTDTVTNVIPSSSLVKGSLRGAAPVGKSVWKHATDRIKSASFRQGIAGAAIGAGGEVIESAVDEDKELNLRDVRDRALIGGLLGSTLGATTEGATGLYRKIAGSSPQDLQRAVFKGDREIKDAVDISTSMADLSELTPAARLNAIGEYFKVNLMPSKVVGKEALSAIRDAESIQRGGATVAQDVSTKVGKIIAALPANQRTEANKDVVRFMAGELDSLPPVLSGAKQSLSEARAQIVKMTNAMLEAHTSGVRPLPEHLVNNLTKQASDGRGWMTRAYRFWSDKDFVPTKKQEAEALSELARDAQFAHLEKLKTTKIKLYSQLKNIQEKSTPKAHAKAGQLKKKIASLEKAKPLSNEAANKRAAEIMARWNRLRRDQAGGVRGMGARDGVLEARKNLGPASRAYLGEIEDAATALEASITRISNVGAWSRADTQVARSLREAGLAVDQSKFTPDMAELSGALGPVKGVYVDPAINDALNVINGSRIAAQSGQLTESLISDVFQSAVSLSKFVKVPLNLASYSTNAVTNFFQVLQQGMFPTTGGLKGVKAAAATFDTIRQASKNVGARQYNKELADNGLIEPGIFTSDILAGLKRGKIGRWIQESPIVNIGGKAYSASDVALRVVVYENYKRNLRKEFPGIEARLGKDQFNKIAADQTKATYQQYSYLPAPIRALSRVGLMNPFVAFTAELIRNQYNQGTLVARMISGAYAEEVLGKMGRVRAPGQSRADFLAKAKAEGLVNTSAIKADAAKRIAGIATLYGAATFGVTAWNRHNGVDEQMEEALYDVAVPDYLEGKQMAFRVKDDGSIEYTDMSYLLPQAQTAAPFMAALRGESWQDASSKAFTSFANQFTGELNFALQTIVPVFGNYDPQTGRKLSTNPEMLANAIERAGWGAKNAFEPGAWRELKNTFGEEARRTPEEFLKRMTAQRIETTTFEEAMGFKVNSIKDDLAKSRTDYARAERNNLLDRERSKIENDFATSFSRIHRHVGSLRKANYDNNEIAGILIDAGFGGKNTLHAINGTTPPLREDTRNTVSNKWEQIAELPAEERRDAILREPDAKMRRDLMQRYKQDLKRERQGMDNIGRIILGQGVADGGRASMIWSLMRQSNNPEGVLQKYRRMNVATPEVVRQIRMMQN
jgi:putative component of toxin-antitoxin plasmid stabilization module